MPRRLVDLVSLEQDPPNTRPALPAPTPWRRAAAGSPYRCRGSARWWRSSNPWWLRPGRSPPTHSSASTSSLSSPPPSTRPLRSVRPPPTSFPSAQISPVGAKRAPVRLLMSLVRVPSQWISSLFLCRDLPELARYLAAKFWNFFFSNAQENCASIY